MAEVLIEDDDYRGSFDPRLWGRILEHLRPFRRQWISLCVIGLVLAVFDVFFPLMTAWLIDEAVAGTGLSRRLVGLFAAYFGVSVVFCLFIWQFIRLAGEVATGVAFDVRKKCFARLQELDFSFFDHRPVGWLVTRLTSDCSKVSGLIPWCFLDFTWGTSFMIGMAVAMFWLDWQLALCVLVIVPPLAWVSLVFQSKMLESSRATRKSNSVLTASFNECIMGVRTTKSLVREESNLREFRGLSGEMERHSLHNSLQSALYLPLIIGIGSIGVGLALWRGGVDFVAGTGLTLGTLIAFMQYAALFYMPVQEMAARFTGLQGAQAAAERIQSLLDEEPAIRDSETVRRGAEPEPDRIETIEFRDVTFGYRESEPVLQDFRLAVAAGQTVALVGATGGGKSTIVNLLARFYEPVSGEILINGVDYRRRSLRWLQSRLGIVLQTPYLFSGTIRENIAYGRLDATDAEIEEAARLVNAHDFIMATERGYETLAGEGGVLFSTGQRQLLSLARAVLARCQILILDEATSSIDTETERLIQDGIEAALEGRTAFVIAHRLSTIRHADVILVIDRGRILERGNHSDLMERDGAYAGLYRNQFARERGMRAVEGRF